MTHRLCKAIVLSLVFFMPSVIYAQESNEINKEAETTIVVSEFADQAFYRYVDLDMLATAWATQDAALLTDAALQLQSGEKELFRSHRVFIAKEIFEKALTVAADKKDMATLQRLAKIAAASGCDDFAAKVAQTSKLAADSRSIHPAIDFLNSKDKPETLYRYASLSELIDRLRSIGSSNYLEKLEEGLKTISEFKEYLTQEQIDDLVKLSSESRAALSDVPEEEIEVGFALEKLSGESRQMSSGSRFGLVQQQSWQPQQQNWNPPQQQTWVQPQQQTWVQPPQQQIWVQPQPNGQVLNGVANVLGSIFAGVAALNK